MAAPRHGHDAAGFVYPPVLGYFRCPLALLAVEIEVGKELMEEVDVPPVGPPACK